MDRKHSEYLELELRLHKADQFRRNTMSEFEGARNALDAARELNRTAEANLRRETELMERASLPSHVDWPALQACRSYAGDTRITAQEWARTVARLDQMVADTDANRAELRRKIDGLERDVRRFKLEFTQFKRQWRAETEEKWRRLNEHTRRLESHGRRLDSDEQRLDSRDQRLRLLQAECVELKRELTRRGL
eukprot:945398_1